MRSPAQRAVGAPLALGPFATIANYVPTSTTVNGHALSGNVTVSASDLTTGTLPAAQLPNPSASTLGGIESIVSASHKWVNSISTLGVPSQTQPACGDLIDSGTACAATIANYALVAGGNSLSGVWDFTSVTRFHPKSGTAASIPGTCTVGDIYFANDATAGQNFYYCTALNTWTQQLNSGGGGSSAWSSLTNGSGISRSRPAALQSSTPPQPFRSLCLQEYDCGGRWDIARIACILALRHSVPRFGID